MMVQKGHQEDNTPYNRTFRYRENRKAALESLAELVPGFSWQVQDDQTMAVRRIWRPGQPLLEIFGTKLPQQEDCLFLFDTLWKLLAPLWTVGVWHGAVHPGNIIVNDANEIFLVDAVANSAVFPLIGPDSVDKQGWLWWDRMPIKCNGERWDKACLLRLCHRLSRPVDPAIPTDPENAFDDCILWAKDLLEKQPEGWDLAGSMNEAINQTGSIKEFLVIEPPKDEDPTSQGTVTHTRPKEITAATTPHQEVGRAAITDDEQAPSVSNSTKDGQGTIPLQPSDATPPSDPEQPVFPPQFAPLTKEPTVVQRETFPSPPTAPPIEPRQPVSPPAPKHDPHPAEAMPTGHTAEQDIPPPPVKDEAGFGGTVVQKCQMGYLDGKPLGELLQQAGGFGLDEQEARQCIRRTCQEHKAIPAGVSDPFDEKMARVLETKFLDRDSEQFLIDQGVTLFKDTDDPQKVVGDLINAYCCSNNILTELTLSEKLRKRMEDVARNNVLYAWDWLKITKEFLEDCRSHGVTVMKADLKRTLNFCRKEHGMTIRPSLQFLLFLAMATLAMLLLVFLLMKKLHSGVSSGSRSWSSASQEQCRRPLATAFGSNTSQIDHQEHFLG